MTPYHHLVAEYARLVREGKSLALGGFPSASRRQRRPDAPKALFFAPHPDDETIVGGFGLRLFRETGMNVINVAVTQGSKKERQAERLRELQAACNYLGYGLVTTGPSGLERVHSKTRERFFPEVKPPQYIGQGVWRAVLPRPSDIVRPRMWLGGEEELLASDLITRGHLLCYLPAATVHHQASVHRDATRRRWLGIRNTLWFTWLRRPPRAALRRTAELAGTVPRDRVSAAAFGAAVRGLPWVLHERRPLPVWAEAQMRLLDGPRRTSRARRYVG